jgi:hypothetical protein
MRDKSNGKRKKPAAPSREGNTKKQPERVADNVGLSGHGAESVLVHLREQERKREKNGKS